YASVRLDVRRTESIKNSGDVVGNRVKVKVKKNKVAPPFKDAEFDIMYNEGISVAGDVLDMATALEIVDKRGAYYSYGDVRLGQGRENAKEFLRENTALLYEIDNKIRESVGLPAKASPPPEQLELLQAETKAKATKERATKTKSVLRSSNGDANDEADVEELGFDD
ncbi:MAG TPA: DNA recombination/repair protein RecA, partial [Chloroflexi bacterium]|nr:DNA recombination/repair protein RecA [Chloroflexota bacterium]